VVRGVSPRSVPELSECSGALSRELREIAKIKLRNQRRSDLLTECSWSIRLDNTEALWVKIAGSFSRGAALSEDILAGLVGAQLAEYSCNGRKVQIAAVDFVRDFMQGVARVAPSDPWALRVAIEDMVVRKFDYAAAVSLGMDQTQQFLEDRGNFELNQALALYEKEELCPQIAVSEDDLRRFYLDHKELYKSPVDITGVLYVYSTNDLARKAQAAVACGNSGSVVQHVERIVDPFVLQRDAPPVSVGVSCNALTALPAGQFFGPFPYRDKFALFCKKTSGELKPPCFEELKERMRLHCLRERLNAMEWERFRENIGLVRVFVDLALYGLVWPIENLTPVAGAERVSTPKGKE